MVKTALKPPTLPARIDAEIYAGSAADGAKISGAYRAIRQRLQNRRDAGRNHRHPKHVGDFFLSATNPDNDDYDEDPTNRHDGDMLEPQQSSCSQRRLIIDTIDQTGWLLCHGRLVSLNGAITPYWAGGFFLNDFESPLRFWSQVGWSQRTSASQCSR